MVSIGSVVVVTFGILIGAGLGYLLRKEVIERRSAKAGLLSAQIIEDAKAEAEAEKKQILLEAKDALYQARAEFEQDSKERRVELSKLESRLNQKEEHLDRKDSMLAQRSAELLISEQKLESHRQALHKEQELHASLILEQQNVLENISAMTAEEAKQELVQRMENEARYEASKTIRRLHEEARQNADKKAKEIIMTSIQRCAADHIAETTVSVVALPNDDMKGRIIGREGRNIRTFESVAGVDLIIDDTPGAVILSGFDPIKREIARISLERLIADGRIHPTRIEEIVSKVRGEMDGIIYEEGEKATFDAGIHGLHPEAIRLLGRLRYRTSYTQNVLLHSKEVAYIAGIMAAELGANIQVAKRAGLLHDIGKAVNHEVEGAHAVIGAELARKYNESKRVIHAIEAHHYDIEPTSLEAVIISAADALSAARPGARREILESYVKRLEKLEEISNSFHGVENSYAIQAGREIRVIVNYEKVSDDEAVVLASDIARRIEKEVEYPGQIKVTVIRETRSFTYAH
ncbi:ribonuclease Y [candidate division KSB3 bacterium]|uniref:Ribonuclease Y n=1 Tax=candidate division KSB3 bacterium TaxID=2044937 RepID=A0A2G6EAD2_9BACT|nr:MAG: ribonuclease Y [candidate division KSB3 bacterium]PIE30790.1 MAG: ribonuclease Y [candidate division KSB3 bacterium]